MAKRKPSFHLRYMIRRDLAECLDIENRSFDYPWDEADFIKAMRQRNRIGMVVEDGNDQVVGFMVYTLYKTKLFVDNFAVHPAYRRLGVGTLMAAKLVEKLSPTRRTRLVLEVQESNLDAQLFWRSQGFKAVSILRNYYNTTDDDCYVFEYRYQTADSEAMCKGI